MLHLIALLERAPPDRTPIRAIDGAVRFVRITPRLAAAVEDRRARAPVDERALHAHDRAVRRLCARAGAVLPARFGVGAASDTALRDALADRTEELAAAFDRVRGREQMTLRIRTGGGAPPPAERRGPRTGRGRRFLERRRDELLVPALDPVRDAVAELVRLERVEPAPTPAFMATVHHLVDRGAARAYARRVASRAGRGGVPPIEVRGPFPPYAFVSAPEPPW